MDSFKNELRHLMNNLSDNTEIVWDCIFFFYLNVRKCSYQNAQTTIADTRSPSLPMTPNQMEQYQRMNLNDDVQSYQIRQQDQKNSRISHSNQTPKDASLPGKTNSTCHTTPSIIKHTSDEFHEKVNTQKSHDHRNKDDSQSQQFSNRISSLTNCADYDPYRNYDQYKAKRLHNNKEKNVS
ncbi:unnamed protein product [Rotaria socialis]|uniref:Uncharacterized protein n=1 Tax=Rotaria socialis TaxID=392032 RepID=A0A818PQU7_9BILA|nr:unnamed protein product [Rotaria socialis]